MTKPIDPDEARQWIWDNAPILAHAKADRIYIEEFKRSKKALLMSESDEITAVAREQYALAHPDYIDLLRGLREAVRTEETLRWRMVSAETSIEIWRSKEASNRRIDKATA